MPDSDDPSSPKEVIIAQEQDALYQPIRGSNLKSGREKVEGTLILTNKRLIFACSDETKTFLTLNPEAGENREEQLGDEVIDAELNFLGMTGPLFYSEIEEIDKITKDPKNLFIPLSKIVSIERAGRGPLSKPALEVSWNDESGRVESLEIHENLIGPSRKKNLNDWVEVIQQLKTGNLEIQEIPQAPPLDTTEGKIAYMMGDMQEKGPSEIEEQVEGAFKIDLDPDDVVESCEKLVTLGFLVKVPDAAEPFYRKRSPVGIYGLSS